MRAAKWALSVVFGALSSMSIGASEAWSQNAFIRVCNTSGIHAWVAITAHPSAGDSRFLMAGWYEIPGRGCSDLKYVGRGWVYLYAESDDEKIIWSGNTQRFCVQYPGPYDRYISDEYSCSASLMKGFIGYYVDVQTFTWTLD